MYFVHFPLAICYTFKNVSIYYPHITVPLCCPYGWVGLYELTGDNTELPIIRMMIGDTFSSIYQMIKVGVICIVYLNAYHSLPQHSIESRLVGHILLP